MFHRFFLLYYLFTLLFFGAIYITGLGSEDTSEYGFFENAQVVVLAITLLLWIVVAAKLAKKETSKRPLPLIVAFSLILSISVFLIREIKWLSFFDESTLLGFVVDDVIKAFAAICLLSILCYWSFRTDNRMKIIKDTVSLRAFKLIIAGGLWMLLGDVFEKKLMPAEQPQYFEELFELMGYLTFLFAVFSLQATRYSIFKNSDVKEAKTDS